MGVTKLISDPENLAEVSLLRDMELKHVVNPSLKKEIEYLFGLY